MKMSEKLRLFVAINFEETVKNRIAAQLKELYKLPGKIKWIKEKNFHLTLKFLGNVEEKKLELIQRALSKVGEEASSIINLTIGSSGTFPDTRYPRVLFLSLKGELELVSNLFKNIERRLRKIGFKKEKNKFKPHITVARVKGTVPYQTILEFKRKFEKFEIPDITIKSFELMKSTLFRDGPVYEKLFSFNIGGLNSG